jgi:hypothetical protein
MEDNVPQIPHPLTSFQKGSFYAAEYIYETLTDVMIMIANSPEYKKQHQIWQK